MNEIELKNKIEAARLKGWSEGYNEGMKAACDYVIHSIDMRDINTIIADLETAVKLCGGGDYEI